MREIVSDPEGGSNGVMSPVRENGEEEEEEEEDGYFSSYSHFGIHEEMLKVDIHRDGEHSDDGNCPVIQFINTAVTATYTLVISAALSTGSHQN